MSDVKRKPRKIQRGGRLWFKLVIELAYGFMIITSCKDCGGPVAKGYCCTRCGSIDP